MADVATQEAMPTPQMRGERVTDPSAPRCRLDFVTYQQEAMRTAFYPGRGSGNVAYAALGLAGESGEVANKVKKVIRDDGGVCSDARRLELASEVGDVLWYAAAMAEELGVTLEDIAQSNLMKLKLRQQSGSLGGSGDHR
uniref:NTP pyrophosphohydrolase MazG-like domain-containing protein n=1 Tax=Noctiluca scintillans TaxID=2966 RepID=A0A7S1A2P2_NOCSC|mmetsp:Transcript_28915/g.76289  ORF Transcript_28915/g.76289 Transcript_28915/m.76289 type:complete len:140 (+) Transcript_28915:61-480(+)